MNTPCAAGRHPGALTRRCPQLALARVTLRLAVIALALGLLTVNRGNAFVVATDPQTGAPLHWPATKRPQPAGSPEPTSLPTAPNHVIRFHLATDRNPAPEAIARQIAIRAAFGQWQSVPGTSLRFEEGEPVPYAPDLMDPDDGTNIVYWAKTPALLNRGTISLRGLLGLTITSAKADGTVLGADIVLNGFERNWFTDFNDPQNPAFFAETTLLHEIGHLLGLDHAPIGGTTMSPLGGTGVDARHGLSPDETAFARTAYGAATNAPNCGHLTGRVLMNDAGLYGAAVSLEDSAGNLLGATLAGTGGRFSFHTLPPGTHQIRAWPLDPDLAPQALIRGADIGDAFYRAATSFLPTHNQPVTVAVGQTNSLDLAVTSGPPAFRIAYIRQPAPYGHSTSLSPLPALLHPGQSNLIIGVYSPDLPLSNVSLAITGDGLTLGTTLPQPELDFGNGLFLRGLLLNVSVASNATPGLRSFVIQQGAQLAYANGFVKILPPVPDCNFDGLDDRFQRRHFANFTAPEAAPEADPDGDGINNVGEQIAGTDPVNRASFFAIDRVLQNAAGTTVEWRSCPGKRYQIFTKPDFGPGPWTRIGLPVTATAIHSSFHDAGATDEIRFYRVQVLP